jgi:multidrug efflux pump subunit AcrA (membrane-fusion protein)
MARLPRAPFGSSPTASKQTRTYRVDVELPNRAGEIPDGVTAEVEFRLKPVTAARVPRSALTFTAEGTLGIRTVDDGGLVRSVAVTIIEDARGEVWPSGLTGNANVIVRARTSSGWPVRGRRQNRSRCRNDAEVLKTCRTRSTTPSATPA